jgi:prepilin peptidase CpaA
MSILDILIVAILIGSMVVGAISDIRRLEIPNWVSIVLITIYIPGSLMAEVPYSNILIQYCLAFGLFALGAFAYYFGFLGGGDIKFVSAVALWIPWQNIGQFLFYVALLGGVLACIVIIIAKIPALKFLRNRISWINSERGHAQPIPYGLAIAGAGLLMIIQADYSVFSSLRESGV